MYVTSIKLVYNQSNIVDSKYDCSIRVADCSIRVFWLNFCKSKTVIKVFCCNAQVKRYYAGALFCVYVCRQSIHLLSTNSMHSVIPDWWWQWSAIDASYISNITWLVGVNIYGDIQILFAINFIFHIPAVGDRWYTSQPVTDPSQNTLIFVLLYMGIK